MSGSKASTCLASRWLTASRKGWIGAVICFHEHTGSALSASAIEAGTTLEPAANMCGKFKVPFPPSQTCSQSSRFQGPEKLQHQTPHASRTRRSLELEA